MKKTASIFVAALMLLSIGTAHAALDQAVLARIKDAVVLIDVKLKASSSGEESEASGSGFVVNANGEIVTNAHVVAKTIEVEGGGTVVADEREVVVTFHPNTPRELNFPARVLRENPKLDLALLKIDTPTPTYLTLADSDMVYETQPVYVAGHPLGLREISIRSGAIAAIRTWEGAKYLEHDCAAEAGNSGGPLVNEKGEVLGVHTLTLAASNMMTKFAIPSNVVDIWLKSAEASDPEVEAPGAAVKALLTKANLSFTDQGDGMFTLPYDNDITLTMHQFKDFVRGFVDLGELPGSDAAEQGQMALRALHCNFDDLAGRLSLYQPEENKYELYWEFQGPFSVATPEFVTFMAMVGAQQASYWNALLKDPAAAKPEGVALEGDRDQLFDTVGKLLDQTGITYETDRSDPEHPRYKLSVGDGDNAVTVRMQIYRGTIWTYCYLGGMPGKDAAEQGTIAIELLKLNWDDPFGRLSLDGDNDLTWESQIPVTFLTPDYLAILANTCASQAISFWAKYGHTPFNGS